MTANLCRITVIATVVLCLSAIQAQAAAAYTLSELKDKCMSATATNQARCASYIDGVIRGYLATVAILEKHNIRLAFFCGPSLETHDMPASRAYARKYIMSNSHPGDDLRDAELVIFEALREAYGCKD